jgi:FKBP-type peptidyl-prolyl cis-trans isomerase
VDGTQFNSNIGGEPFGFILGEQDVIDGWEQGLLGMW